jgi:hypothetical protein
MPRSFCLSLGMKAVYPVLYEVVGVLYDAPAEIPPKGLKLAKPPRPAGVDCAGAAP